MQSKWIAIYSERQFIAEFIKYAHKVDQIVISILNVSFPV